jgi:fumarate reductase subunit C
MRVRRFIVAPLYFCVHSSCGLFAVAFGDQTLKVLIDFVLRPRVVTVRATNLERPGETVSFD